MDGKEYIGNAELKEGEIHWDDGEVWERETISNAPTKAHLLDATSVASCKLDDLQGYWYTMDSDEYLGQVSDDTLIWHDGEQSAL